MKMKYTDNKYLLLFFAITLMWTWGFGFAPIILGCQGTSLGTFLFYFGGGAPSVVGLFLVCLTYPRKARKDYFRRCFDVSLVGWKCLFFLIIFYTCFTVIALMIGTTIFHLEMPGIYYIEVIKDSPPFIFVILFFSILSGPLNEEFGWRGYSLDKLLVRFGFLKSSLILGFIWGIWHAAWYFTPGQAQYNLLQSSILEALLFIPSTMLLSIFVSIIYIKTKRSILAGALTHMLSNLISSQLIAPYSAQMGTVIRCVMMVGFAIAAIYALTSKKFRQEVSYQIEHIKEDELKFCIN